MSPRSRPRAARRADRPVACLPAPAPRHHRARRRGARDASARSGGRPHPGGAGGGRGVPGRRQAHGQPGRPLTRVRARALGAAVEAARHRAPTATPRRRPVTRTETLVVLALAVAAALAIKMPALFGMTLRTATPSRSMRATPASSCCRSSRRISSGSAGWIRATGSGWRVPFIAAAAVVNTFPFTRVLSRRSHTEMLACCTCRSRCGWSSASPTCAAAGSRAPAAWTSSASRASCSSTTCSSPWAAACSRRSR